MKVVLTNNLMSVEDDEQLIFTSDSEESESGTSSESESEPEVIAPAPKKATKPKKITPSKLGPIHVDPTPPPPPRVYYQTHNPITDKRKLSSIENLKKARAARSAKAALRKQEELKKQLGQYEFKQPSESESSDEEVVLTTRKVQKTLPKEKPVLEKKVYTLPKEKKEKAKIILEHPSTIKKEQKIKELTEKLANLEKIVIQQSMENKKERRKKTIINVNTNEPAPEKPKLNVNETLNKLGLIQI